MSHFRVCAMVSIDIEQEPQAFLDGLDQLINDKFQKFDINLEVPPHKFYIEPKALEGMAEHYKTKDLQVLASKMKDWNDDEGGVDEKGLFAISKHNPKGYIDNWGIEEVVPDVNILLKEDFIAQAILTPEGEWIDSGNWFYSVGPSNQKEFDTWKQKFNELLVKYEKEGTICVLVDCHT